MPFSPKAQELQICSKQASIAAASRAITAAISHDEQAFHL